MPRLVALKAVFGQDEANHGIKRYRVGSDGIVRVPPEAAFHLLGRGGFAVASPPAAVAERWNPGRGLPGSLVRLQHDAAAGCSYRGREYRGDKNGVVIVPAEAVAELTGHGFVPPAADRNSPFDAAEKPPNS
jgi:hypothetical protein